MAALANLLYVFGLPISVVSTKSCTAPTHNLSVYMVQKVGTSDGEDVYFISAQLKGSVLPKPLEAPMITNVLPASCCCVEKLSLASAKVHLYYSRVFPQKSHD